ncbi:hypothetical protein ASE43_14105 [Lysobacter sp. Root983]|nr:hypothetical protein ASE43_14105 [Lysobacter sp. Root983]
MTEILDPDKYEAIFPSTSKTQKGQSYIEKKLGLGSIDKVELALKCSPHMTIENMSERFDWLDRMNDLVSTIRKWND